MSGDPLALQPKCHAKAQKAQRRKCYALLIVVKGALTMSQLEIPLSVEWVKRMILILRGKIAMHDADLVDLHEVKTDGFVKSPSVRLRRIALHLRRCSVPCKYASLLMFCAPCPPKAESFLHCHPNYDFLRVHQD